MKFPSIPKHAPTLYVIIGFKAIKCLLAIATAFGLHILQHKDLPELFQKLIIFLHQDPAKHFCVQLAEKVETITPTHIHHIMLGAIGYATMLAIQATGLLFGVRWIFWFSIIEAAALVPVEIWELIEKPGPVKFTVFVINLGIVWYLFKNRARLIHHKPA